MDDSTRLPIASDDSPAVSALGNGDVCASVLSMTSRSNDGDDASYLRWHGLDHLPEQYRLAGLRHGARWVSTPACRAARAASEPRFDDVDHVVQYLFADPLEDSLEQFFSLGAALYRAGRLPMQLPSVQLGGYRFTRATASPGEVVGAAVLPWRPTRGIHLLLEEGASAAPLQPLVDVDGVVGCWCFDGSDSLHPRLSPTGGLSLTVLYLDDDPVIVAERLRARLTQRWDPPAVTPLLAAPFVPVVPFEWDAALP